MIDMSAFDAMLIGVIVTFIGFLIKEKDAKRLKIIILIFAALITALIVLAYLVGWRTILPIPHRFPDAVAVPIPELSVPAPSASGDITFEQAVNRIKRGIDEFIAAVLIYGMMIGFVVSIIKSLFK